MAKLNEYRLRKWARACRLRDKNTCQMCGRVGGPIQVHHCRPKARYPEYAYRLDNGVSLCAMCHKIVVHAGNTFDLNNWMKFMPLFRYFMRLAPFRNFNEKYQDRI